MTATKKTAKYTPEMVAMIAAIPAPLNLAKCVELAANELFVEAGISARGIVAKARTMGVAYEKQTKVTKTGEPVARKDELVHEIEKAMGLTGLDSLAKAEKPALRSLLTALQERVA
jgi:hypothetical protein